MNRIQYLKSLISLKHFIRSLNLCGGTISGGRGRLSAESSLVRLQPPMTLTGTADNPGSNPGGRTNITLCLIHKRYKNEIRGCEIKRVNFKLDFIE